MKNEEFGCAMQACRKVILHSSFLVLHFDKLSFMYQVFLKPYRGSVKLQFLYLNSQVLARNDGFIPHFHPVIINCLK